ncbi:MAG: phosphatase [Defluviitaleaceae bacterium]|nr:phosphatase [Defluviitaleaceae bacterium]
MKYILDTHCHTVASGHAYSTIEECAARAAAKGLKLLAITDHAPEMPGTTAKGYFVNLKCLPRFIGGVEILPGVELNITDYGGKVDLSDGILKNLKVVIASLHPNCIEPGTAAENTRAVISAMENPRVNILGHLCDPNFPVDIARIVKAAGQAGKVIEINDESLNPYAYRYAGEEPFLEMLRLCGEHGVSVVAASDAHMSNRVGDLSRAAGVIAKSAIPWELVLNDSVEKLKKALKIGE